MPDPIDTNRTQPTTTERSHTRPRTTETSTPKPKREASTSLQCVEFWAQFRPAALPHREAVIERLEALLAERRIAKFDVAAWPARVSLGDDRLAGDVIERFETFEAWADDRGLSVRPPFEVTTASSIVTETAEPVLKTPVMCLAVYDDGALAGVFPCSDDDRTYTVFEALRAIEEESLLPPERRQGTTNRSHPPSTDPEPSAVD